MTQDIDKEHFYFEQTRSEKQILLTNVLAQALTEINLKRVEQYTKNDQNINNKKKQNFLYVILPGLPAIPGEFDGIQFPGETLMFYPECFQPNLTQNQQKERLKNVEIEKQAAKLNSVLEKKDKKIILIFHSFGTSIASVFLRLYWKEYAKQIVGMIPIGPYPIRVGTSFKYFVEYTEELTRKELMQNLDHHYEAHLLISKQFRFYPNNNKYENAAQIIAFGSGLGFKQMFHWNRMWPHILKCFIYGRKDSRIEVPLLNQMAIYYAYKKKFQNQDYVERTKKVFKERYNMKVENIQERFIYSILTGKHSLHSQMKLKKQITNIISEYLSFIEKIID